MSRTVMPGPGTPSRKRDGEPPVPGIHVSTRASKTWIAGTSPAMTAGVGPRRPRVGATTGAGSASYALPPTVSAHALIEKGSDHRFRMLVNDLFTIASRMEMVRNHLGRRMGLSGPQYSLLMAVAHLQGERGASVGTVAQAMHVSSAFIASETGKMAKRGLLHKRPNPDDRRGVLLSLAPAGRLRIDRVACEIRAINDLFFGALDASSFGALSAAAAALVKGSSKAVRHIHAMEAEPADALKATA